MGVVPEHAASTDEVKEIEACVDEHFSRRSGATHLWIPPALEQVLDVAEEIITGHRAPQAEYAIARARLALTTANNVTLAVKTIVRLRINQKTNPPFELKNVP